MDTEKRPTPGPRARAFSTPLVASACALYGATVAARLGGGWREVTAAALAGLAGGILYGNALVERSVSFGRAFVAALSAALAVLVFVPEPSAAHLGRALCGGLAGLAPVALVAVAAGELARGAVESSVRRLAEAGLRAAALVLGIGTAVMIGALGAGAQAGVALSPAPAAPAVLASPLAVGLAVLGGLALTVCLQARWRDAPLVVGGVLVACAAQAMSHLLFGPAVGAFLSAFLLGAVAIVAGRISGRTPALLIVPGLMQLGTACFAPEAALRLVSEPSFAHDGTALRLLLLGAMMVSGLVAAETAFKRCRPDGRT